MHSPRIKWLLLAWVATVMLLVASGWSPYDRATWVMEVVPVMIALPLLWVTYPRYPLTTLLYVCIFVHAVVLLVGGAYSYARVPLGFQLQEVFHLSRNPY